MMQFNLIKLVFRYRLCSLAKQEDDVFDDIGLSVCVRLIFVFLRRLFLHFAVVTERHFTLARLRFQAEPELSH